MFDLLCLGEILIDFAPINGLYQPNPGGAPANVACAAAKLGLKSAFVGQVGPDGFGALCRQALHDAGCCTDYLYTGSAPTTLAFVTLSPEGDRSFAFYRTGTADVSLDSFPDVECRAFHFGSVSLTTEPIRSTTLRAAETAKQKRAIITYDPNLRLALWPDAEAAKREMLHAMPLADYVKLAEEEVAFLFDEPESEAIPAAMAQYGLTLVVVTRAERGCTAYFNGKTYDSPALNVTAVDTTGAGDSFWAGLLSQLLKNGLSVETLPSALHYANTVGGIVTTRRGAIPALPTADEVSASLKDQETSQERINEK